MILSILDGPDSQNGIERRRYLLIGLLALAVLLVAVLGVRQIRKWVTPTQEVYVASSNLPAGATVGADNVIKKRIAESSLPSGVLDARSIAGRELSRAKQEGEPFTRDDFAGVAEEQTIAVAEMVPEGRVLATIRVPSGLVPYKNLKSGDRVDVVSITGERGSGVARVVAHDAYVVGTMYTKSRPEPQRTGLAALVPPSNSRKPVNVTVGLLLALDPYGYFLVAPGKAGGDRALEGIADLGADILGREAERGSARGQLHDQFLLAVRQVVVDGADAPE